MNARKEAEEYLNAIPDDIRAEPNQMIQCIKNLLKELEATELKLDEKWKDINLKQPEKEGWYNTIRTLHDSPKVNMYLKNDGFGVNSRVGFWCEIPSVSDYEASKGE